MSPESDTGKQYHLRTTGAAAETVEAHNEPADITLYGACFCPFVHRVWAAFEYLGIPYHYYEVDPYKKPKDLLEISPKGLVPALRFEQYSPPRSLNESTVILEFLEDLAQTVTKRSLLPPLSLPYARALVRLACDHINRTLVPAFYRYLQAQEPVAQISGGQEFHEAIESLVSLLERAERELPEDEREQLGLWSTDELGLVDVMAGPWLFRASNVLVHYRGFKMPEGPKFAAWVEKLFAYPAFARTCSTEQLYLDSYERYAFNRPNTSQVADAINSGRGLP